MSLTRDAVVYVRAALECHPSWLVPRRSSAAVPAPAARQEVVALHIDLACNSRMCALDNDAALVLLMDMADMCQLANMHSNESHPTLILYSEIEGGTHEGAIISITVL